MSPCGEENTGSGCAQSQQPHAAGEGMKHHRETKCTSPGAGLLPQLLISLSAPVFPTPSPCLIKEISSSPAPASPLFSTCSSGRCRKIRSTPDNQKNKIKIEGVCRGCLKARCAASSPDITANPAQPKVRAEIALRFPKKSRHCLSITPKTQLIQ